MLASAIKHAPLQAPVQMSWAAAEQPSLNILHIAWTSGLAAMAAAFLLLKMFQQPISKYGRSKNSATPIKPGTAATVQLQRVS
jgi:hypothetical protein